MRSSVAVSVLGTNELVQIPIAAFHAVGEPLLDPLPFAAPCSDGFLLFYTTLDGVSHPQGAYAKMPVEYVQSLPVLKECWEAALKPLTMSTLIQQIKKPAAYTLN